jgi:hypothetical protein
MGVSDLAGSSVGALYVFWRERFREKRAARSSWVAILSLSASYGDGVSVQEMQEEMQHTLLQWYLWMRGLPIARLPAWNQRQGGAGAGGQTSPDVQAHP